MALSPPPARWSTLRNKPTTLADFGISDAFANSQTWQNVTASRSANVTYTNSTGRPIKVKIRIAGSPYNLGDLFVDGVALDRVNSGGAGYSQDGSISAIVPNGSTYQLTNVVGSFIWYELR